MTMYGPLRRLLPWAGVVLLSAAVAFAAIEIARIFTESNYRTVLGTEVKRRSLEVTAVTMNSNVMGSVTALGLINQTAKGVLRGVTPLDHPAITEALEAIGTSYRATGVYLINAKGIVQSAWQTIGTPLTGEDVTYRPYFQIAMKGRQNVYAAIGTTTGQRALYFAAPLYDEASTSGPVIGAAVARLPVERIDFLLSAWTAGPALLLSPHSVTYASNRKDLLEGVANQLSAEQLKTIRESKQFGTSFDSGTPKTLPFSINSNTASFESRRYALSRAAVQWNDPQGDWTLVLLGNLEEAMPPGRRSAIGGASGALVLVLGSVFLVWRRRLRRISSGRQQAERELKATGVRLEAEAESKSFLAEISADLQQATSLADFGRRFMLAVPPRVGAEYGALYVLDEQTQRLTAVEGHGTPASALESVSIGQGLVGQCAKGRSPIVISETAQTDIRIAWGEGKVAPKSIILLPVVRADRLLGVVVLATLRAIDAEKRALLDALVPTAAMNLEILQRNLATRRNAEILQQQQTQLKETESWYRSIIESAPDGMLVVDEEGVIILTNPRADALFGYDAGTLLGQKIEVLVPPAVRPRHPALRQGFAQGGGSRFMGTSGSTLRGLRRDGSEFPVEVGLSALPAVGGRGLCVCAAIRDVTERRVRGSRSAGSPEGDDRRRAAAPSGAPAPNEAAR